MKSILRFITCGSVDDGKSTLIGHMLYDAKLLFADQEEAIEAESRASNSEGILNYSLLLDGLMAEREQSITIDVAYRYFTTKNRSFIVADCPGHEQYTRNMVVGAAFADVAIILVDASKGISTQTRRHVRICVFMGIKHIVLAVNKMDIIHYDRKRFEEIRREFKHAINNCDLESFTIIPVSATEGDNLNKKSINTPWYKGEPLLTYLEKLNIEQSSANDVFLMPVQRVCRPAPNFRGYQGQIENGSISVGDEVFVLPGNERARISKLYVTNNKRKSAYIGQAVTICLDKEIDISRGSVLMKRNAAEFDDHFRATVIWLGDVPLMEGRNYFIKCGTMEQPAKVTRIYHKIEIDSGKNIYVSQVLKNEFAYCEIVLSQRMAFNYFKLNQSIGQFILIERLTNQTVGCGIIELPLHYSNNIMWQKTDITRAIRASQKGQKPCTVWFTGLSGSGKSTIANMVEKRLVAEGKHTMLLDGDNMRHGLCRDLGFVENDRSENVRRVAEVAKLLNDAGLIVLTAFISPYQRDRESAKQIIGDENYIEIYMSTPLEICERRDTKGLYEKAKKGDILYFTGISSSYEVPVNPNIEIDTSKCTLEESVEKIIKLINVKSI